MEKDEINQALRDLGVAVDKKMPTATFTWIMGIFVTLSVLLIGGLYVRQSTLVESVASINTTLQQTKETSAAQGLILSSIASTQTQLAITVGIMAGGVKRTAKDMRELTKEIRGGENISSDIVARIAREQIAWADERKKKLN